MGNSYVGRHFVGRLPLRISADEGRHETGSDRKPRTRTMKKVLVIGGGLAGLSAGFHLVEHRPVLFEREEKLGGLCRSFQQDGFTFDCTGHLIHLKNKYTKDLIARLLPDNFDSHQRLAAIYSKSTVTPYPFQANTYGLPPEVIKECIVGFVETLHYNGIAPQNFHEWVV